MTRDRIEKGFWRSSSLIVVTLGALAILVNSATVVSRLPHGRFPAMMLDIMASSAILDNPGVTGYYERLFAASSPKTRRNSHFIYDYSFRIVRNRPNLDRSRDGLTTNGFGLIGRDCSLGKPPNTRRIALFGDSVAEGWGVNWNQSFGALLEDYLNTASDMGSQRFEVLNFSVEGYELTQILGVMDEDAPRFDTDVYVLALTELGVFRNWSAHLVNLTLWGIDPKYPFLRGVLQEAKVSRGDEQFVLYGKLAPFRMVVLKEVLSQMKRNVGHRGEFIVVLVPTVEDGELTKERFSGVHELLASLNITTIDLLDTFEGIPDLDVVRFRGMHPANVHPNERGQAMIFANLVAKLREAPAAQSALLGRTKAVQRAIGRAQEVLR